MAHLLMLHGTLVCRGTQIENHCSRTFNRRDDSSWLPMYFLQFTNLFQIALPTNIYCICMWIHICMCGCIHTYIHCNSHVHIHTYTNFYQMSFHSQYHYELFCPCFVFLSLMFSFYCHVEIAVSFQFLEKYNRLYIYYWYLWWRHKL